MITISKWVRAPRDDSAFHGENIIGGTGGCIEHGDRWGDLLSNDDPSVHPYLEAIRASGVRICGDCHQHREGGSPIFSDGKQGLFSFRGWADIMAASAAEKTNTDHSYMDFYMGCARCQE